MGLLPIVLMGKRENSPMSTNKSLTGSYAPDAGASECLEYGLWLRAMVDVNRLLHLACNTQSMHRSCIDSCIWACKNSSNSC